MKPKHRRPNVAERFAAFHRENPHVYQLFKRFACEARAAGRDRFSADALLHRIRWFSSVVTRGDEFKMNNDWAAMYARLLIAEDPSFEGFFELRKAAGDAEPERPAGCLF